MKQILQSYKTGELWLAKVPTPVCKVGGIVIRNRASFLSAGTERMLVDFAKKNLVGKALAMPDQVRRVIRKMKAEGLVNTLEKVKAKLDQPIPLGYSCAGVVEEVGSGVSGVAAGDRVACGGAGYANHAEYNYVPRNLVVRIPEGVSDADASCATVGSIALQGVRQADVRLGEVVGVIGLGLLGLLAVQLLKAGGARVIGFDPDASKTNLAMEMGADAVAVSSKQLAVSSKEMTDGHGVDAVLITAATKSSEPVALAGDLCRIRGKVVVTGLVGMDIPRDQYYKKELDFKLSLSYGPGRYDTAYEEGGHDYPYGFVRWTEQRNMKAFLDLVAEGKVMPSKLVTHRFNFEDALDAYSLMLGKTERYLGIVLKYNSEQRTEERGRRAEHGRLRSKEEGMQTVQKGAERKEQMGRVIQLKPDRPLITHHSSLITPTIGFIGAGNFAKGVLLPQLRKLGDVRLKGICTATGMGAAEIGKKEGFEFATTDYVEILKDPDINSVFIATRHNSHYKFVCEALKAEKNVFVEKPLCLNEIELAEIESAHCSPPTAYSPTRITHHSSPILMAGFNRRFSPLVRKMKETVRNRPMMISYRVNAGVIPREVWIQDLDVGGGRIVGEVCHFVDTVSYLSGSAPRTVYAGCVRKSDQSIPDEDNLSILIGFENGSVGNIIYTAYGSPLVPKEFVSISCGDMTLQMDDFQELKVSRRNKKERTKLRGQDKGFQGELAAFVEGLKTGVAPIPFESLVMTTQVTFGVRESLRSGMVVKMKVSSEQ